MAADDEFRRPEGMDERLFQALRLDYDKARSRHGMSVQREAKPATIARNERLLEEARVQLRQRLDVFITSSDLRASLAAGSTSTNAARELLEQYISTQTQRHNDMTVIDANRHAELMNALGNIRLQISSSSSVVVISDIPPAAAPAPALETDDCVVCMTERGHVKFPCCFRPGNDKLACISCFMLLLSKGDRPICPCCRQPIDFEHSMYADLLPSVQSWLPQRVLEELRRPGMKNLIPLVTQGRDITLDFMNYHCELNCDIANDSNLSMRNPTRVEVIVTGDTPWKLKFGLHELSVRGDAVDNFVQTVLRGVWPARDCEVKVMVKGSPYPSLYRFMKFSQNYNDGPACHFDLVGMDDKIEEVIVPLSSITAMKVCCPWKIADLDEQFRIESMAEDYLLVKFWDGDYHRVTLKEFVTDDTIGPRLKLRKKSGSEYFVYLSCLERIEAIHCCEFDRAPVNVYGAFSQPGGKLPIGSKVRLGFTLSAAHIPYREVLMNRVVTFWGYSARYANLTVNVSLHSSHCYINVKHLMYIDFVSAP